MLTLVAAAAVLLVVDWVRKAEGGAGAFTQSVLTLRLLVLCAYFCALCVGEVLGGKSVCTGSITNNQVFSIYKYD